MGIGRCQLKHLYVLTPLEFEIFHLLHFYAGLFCLYGEIKAAVAFVTPSIDAHLVLRESLAGSHPAATREKRTDASRLLVFAAVNSACTRQKVAGFITTFTKTSRHRVV